MTIEETVRAYAAAWNENDDARRAELLETCWAADGVLVIPRGEIVGRRAVFDLIASYRSAQPTQRAVVAKLDHHHRCFRIQALAVNANGTPRAARGMASTL